MTLLLADTDVSLGYLGRSKHQYPKGRRPEKTSRRLVYGINLIEKDSLILYSQGSYYSALEKQFEQHVLRKPSKMNITIIFCSCLLISLENATDRLELAENVVKESLKSRPSAWFWFGSFSTLTRFLDTFAWRTIWVGSIR